MDTSKIQTITTISTLHLNRIILFEIDFKRIKSFNG